jgi:hypothetical protein
MDDTDYIKLIERVRRDTRVSDVIDLCNEAAARHMQAKMGVSVSERSAPRIKLDASKYRTPDGKFDRRTYQRDYMRARSKVICENGNADLT